MALLEKNKEEEQDLVALAAKLEELEKPETIEIFGFNKETHVEPEIEKKEEIFEPQVTRKEFEELKAELNDFMEGIDSRVEAIEAKIDPIVDFYNRTSEVVVAMAEQATFEAVEIQLKKSWEPHFERVLDEVEKIKNSSTQDTNSLAEVKLHLPLLRRLSTLGPMVDRAEKAASLVDSHVRRFTDKKEPASAAGPGLLGR